MVRFLLNRPIAVFLSFFAAIIFSLVALKQLPVSLLPSVDIPELIIKVSYPNSAPEEIEKNVMAPLRENFLPMSGLKDLETIASNETGTVKLKFDFNTPMDLAYIDANERMDRLMEFFPDDLGRPQIVKLSATDIPVIRVQVLPTQDNQSISEISDFVQQVIRKRFEQIEGVSLVDVSGTLDEVIYISPNTEKMDAVGVSISDVMKVIRAANQNLGGVSVRNGQYRYFIKVENRLDDPESIASLPFRTQEGKIITLSEVLSVRKDIAEPHGYHLYNGKDGIVLNIHKQSAANLTQLVPKLEQAIQNFRKDYPYLTFETSQDQSLLLKLSLNNLRSSLLYGGFFAFLVLFLFFGNYRLPIIMGISIPVSLFICFLFFWFFEMSINIISLSGLALGVGMLIDNAIIVVDNITQKRKDGIGLFESCATGVTEVIPALISSVLTTLAVFVPLVFLSGVSGVLFHDQALSVAIILSVSLLVAFMVIPLLYHLLYRKNPNLIPKDASFFFHITKIYQVGARFSHRNKLVSLTGFVVISGLGFFLSTLLNLEGIPNVSDEEKVVSIQWNEPITIEENKARTQRLLSYLATYNSENEADIGLTNFLMNSENQELQSAFLYLKTTDEIDSRLKSFFEENFHQANYQLSPATNAFDQLFESSDFLLECRLATTANESLLHPEPIEKQFSSILKTFDGSLAKGFDKGTTVNLTIDQSRLNLYGIPYSDILDQINRLFGNYLVTEIKSYGQIDPVMIKVQSDVISNILRSTFITNKEGAEYPLNTFITYEYQTDFKNIYADKSGIFQSLAFNKLDDPSILMNQVSEEAKNQRLIAKFTGDYFQNLSYLKEIGIIMVIAVLLLYFILAAQFESFLQPLIVIFTVPLAVGGGLLLLSAVSDSLNIMGAIGLVVTAGIIVNDSILKIDTINRLRSGGAEMLESVKTAGVIRLKPILMTTFTTILALTPVLFFEGAGARLQFSLVIAVIGGLIVGTLASLYVVPILYIWFSKTRGKVMKVPVAG